MPQLPGDVLGASEMLLPVEAVAQYAYNAGFRGDALVTIVAICFPESGLDAHKVGDIDLTGPGERSIGLTQINYRPWRDQGDAVRDPQANLDPGTNLRHAYTISGGGTRFTPWSTYNNGKYKPYLQPARDGVAIAKQQGGIGAGPTDPSQPGFDVVENLPPVLLRIGGQLSGDELGYYVTGGGVDLTTSEVSELTVTLDDPELAAVRRHNLVLGSSLAYLNLPWAIVELEAKQGPANGEQVTLRAHPLGVVRMRSGTPTGAQYSSPTNFMAVIARAVGLGFVGELSAVAPSITAQMVTDKTGAVQVERPETAWDIGVRLAGDLGFLFFEAGGVLHFASPKYLANRAERVGLTWRDVTAPGPLTRTVNALTAPTCRATRRDFRPAGVPTGLTWLATAEPLQDTTVSATVDRDSGTVLRPGMALSLGGMQQFDGPGKLITRVSWSIDDLVSPVTVEAQLPQDITGANRTAADDAASGSGTKGTDTPGVPFGERPGRISGPQRILYFGQPGDRVRTSSYTTPWGISVTVHQAVAPRFREACEDAAAHASWRPRRIDSYSVRKIRGSTTEWSLHAFGLAWDFFASPPNVDPPGGVWGPESAPDAGFRDIFKRHGFYSGADYSNRKDYPHIEWAGMPPTST